MEEKPDTATTMRGIRIKGPPYTGEIVEDYIALEAPINLYINDKLLITIFATPHRLKELAVGHLVGEGIVDKPEEIEDIVIDGFDILTYVSTDERKLQERIKEHDRIRLIYSSCGSIEDYIRALDRVNKPRVNSDFRITADRLFQLITQFGHGSKSFKHSISVHTAAAYDGEKDQIIGFVEDVSRHVTVDRAVGMIVLGGVNPARAIILTTGRQASDMVLKAARTGVPITVSLRGPLFSGVYTALKTGITMASIVRGKGLTVYSHPERIVLDSLKDIKQAQTSSSHVRGD